MSQLITAYTDIIMKRTNPRYMDLQDDEEEPVIMEVDIDAKKSAYIVLLCPSHDTDTTVLIHSNASYPGSLGPGIARISGLPISQVMHLQCHV